METNRKTKIICPSPWSHHHSGWPYTVCGLYKHLHKENGVHFYTNSVVTEIFQSNQVMKKPWIAVLHATPSEEIRLNINREICKQSLQKCYGIYALSDYLRYFLENENITCETLKLCVSPPKKEFDLDACFRQGRLIMIGYWMRKFESIYRVKSIKFPKAILQCTNKKHKPSVAIIPYQNRDEYEKIISENLIFLDLIDASANNTVVECIVRSTPVIINRLEAVEEYLGKNYPLFFEDLKEVPQLLVEEKIIDAHKYLKSLDKEPFKLETMIKNILESKIYQSLPNLDLVL